MYYISNCCGRYVQSHTVHVFSDCRLSTADCRTVHDREIESETEKKAYKFVSSFWGSYQKCRTEVVIQEIISYRDVVVEFERIRSFVFCKHSHTETVTETGLSRSSQTSSH